MRWKEIPKKLIIIFWPDDSVSFFIYNEFWMIIRSFLYFFTIVRTGTISIEKVSIIDSLNNKISFYLDEYHLYFSLQVKYLGDQFYRKLQCYRFVIWTKILLLCFSCTELFHMHKNTQIPT